MAATVKTSTLRTPLCEKLNIDVPIILAGMGRAAGPELTAAVSNAGGLGVLGQAQLVVRPLEHQLREILVQCVVDLLEDLARRREGVGQRLAHANFLRPLAGKNECHAHGGWFPGNCKVRLAAAVIAPAAAVSSQSHAAWPDIHANLARREDRT